MQGMFIIDEIEFDGGKKIKDIIGGAGSFGKCLLFKILSGAICELHW